MLGEVLSVHVPDLAHAQDREREKEKELIKQQYLGADKVRKKILKPSEKFRFNFDWEANDDTSRDLNPLYNNTHEAALLFGRGLRAGVDRREQMKAAAAHQKELLRKMRESTARARPLLAFPPCDALHRALACERVRQ